MKQLFRIIWHQLRRKRKFRVLESGMAREAFRMGGRVYYCFDDSSKMPASRAIAAMGVYSELEMRCDRAYLEKHIQAMSMILSDPKKIDIEKIARINANLRERLNLAPFPDHVLKLASVIFFDDIEEVYGYDYAYNEAKIARWKKDPNILAFFLQMQFKKLIPVSMPSENDAEMYSRVAEKVADWHQSYLTAIIGEK